MRALRVFLDSSDYSTLSDPRADESLKELLRSLVERANSGRVAFYYSGTVLSEMAPLSADYASAASRRADVLVSLCGPNALVSQDRLLRYELSQAHGIDPSLRTVYSDCGEWFPEGTDDFLPVRTEELRSGIEEVIDTTAGLNRQARRAAKRRLLKNGAPKPQVAQAIIARARSQPLDELLASLPMRPEDARTLSRYYVGDAAPEDAENTFRSSLSDPRWMMQWFAKHHSGLSPFIEWTRKPAASCFDAIQRMCDLAETMRDLESRGVADAAAPLTQKAWAEREVAILLDISARGSLDLLGVTTPRLSAERVRSACPGLTTTVQSLFSAWRESIVPAGRKPKASDFPDALHAMYAPYVDVFRADSFMAPHIAKQVAGRGTKVVSKLRELPEAIHESQARGSET